jgi:hypothetical protein
MWWRTEPGDDRHARVPVEDHLRLDEHSTDWDHFNDYRKRDWPLAQEVEPPTHHGMLAIRRRLHGGGRSMAE